MFNSYKKHTRTLDTHTHVHTYTHTLTHTYIHMFIIFTTEITGMN